MPVRLRVAGLTEAQAERKIQEVLEANGLVSHPEVTVTVKEKKSKPVTIMGAVAHPTVYQADRPMTLIEILAAAGGIAPDAGDSVIVTRQVQEAVAEPDAASPESDNSAPVPPPLSTTITVNLSQILETGDMSSNIPILPGDVITVPHAGIVYVLGAVQKPGGFVVSNDRAQLTALKVLSLAGGLSRVAKTDRAVIVRRDPGGQQHEVEVDLKKVMKFEAEDVQLRPSDILFVPTSGAKQALSKTAEISLALGTGVLLYRVAQR